MCLCAEVSLIESRTVGYNGQVEMIKKGLIQCYECTPKATQKNFPGYTIPKTHSEPIHCIVRAKNPFIDVLAKLMMMTLPHLSC
ncbi:hypothetical protein GQX74_000214 [Glossina fuscipes]|nr:hypothetical protein GQX74_000214 [Glossina fuscipes]